MLQVFNFTDYKSFTRKALEERGKAQKGVRSRFAEFIGCRSGYITQILSGSPHLSLEQADLASQFFAMTDDEAEYFLLLVIFARSGTKQLKNKIEKQIQRRQQLRTNLKERFKVEEITELTQAVFYSHWSYLAVLTLLSVPQFQTADMLAQQLNLPQKQISEILEFLERSGLAHWQKSKFVPGTRRTHLGRDSAMLSKHHINWRLKAIQSIENKDERALHYSSVIGLSKKDSILVKETLVQTIEKIAKIIEPSPEEHVASFCIDYFDLVR